MTKEEKKRLESQLWCIANELRGKMDADEFRDYILGFIFYKYLSEKQLIFAEELLEGESVEDYRMLLADSEHIAPIKDESLDTLGYFLAPTQLFEAILEKGRDGVESAEDAADGIVSNSKFILDDLQAIFDAIEESTMGTASQDDFSKLFEDIDLASTKLGRGPDARNEIVVKILGHLDKIDFKLTSGRDDILGDAYEYLIGKFAAGAGKKAGEFYTPRQVSKILAKLVTLGRDRIKNAYDPTCGSGSLLLRIGREVGVVNFIGQELNRTTYNLARMNMILHNVHYRDFDIKQDDVLESPQHLDMEFEAVVANPPFSAHWKGNDNPLFEGDERFKDYGKLAPKTKADFAFALHMVHQMSVDGLGAVILPHGVLFRGGAEQSIRTHLIDDKNYLDAIIGLPANLFYGTSIPVCILVLKKCREIDDKIIFIDASAEFDRESNQNHLLDAHVAKIIETYRARKDVEKYARAVTVEEIAANDFNLNIPRYVDTFEEEPPVDMDKVTQELAALEQDMGAIDKKIAAFCKTLGIETPV